jgi:hypothetical protein
MCPRPGRAPFHRQLIKQRPSIRSRPLDGRPYRRATSTRPHRFKGFGGACSLIGSPVYSSAELSHSLKASDRRRNTPKSAQNRSGSSCTGLWAPCRIFGAWFGPALAPNPARNRTLPAGSLKVVGALLAQPKRPNIYDSFVNKKIY